MVIVIVVVRFIEKCRKCTKSKIVSNFCKYLEPINGATVHQCWKFPDPIAKITSNGRHHYHDVKLITSYLDKEIKQSYCASIRLHRSIPLSVYFPHLFTYFCQFFGSKYIRYLDISAISLSYNSI